MLEVIPLNSFHVFMNQVKQFLRLFFFWFSWFASWMTFICSSCVFIYRLTFHFPVDVAGTCTSISCNPWQPHYFHLYPLVYFFVIFFFVPSVSSTSNFFLIFTFFPFICFSDIFVLLISVLFLRYS